MLQSFCDLWSLLLLNSSTALEARSAHGSYPGICRPTAPTCPGETWEDTNIFKSSDSFSSVPQLRISGNLKVIDVHLWSLKSKLQPVWMTLHIEWRFKWPDLLWLVCLGGLEGNCVSFINGEPDQSKRPAVLRISLSLQIPALWDRAEIQKTLNCAAVTLPSAELL